MKNRTDIRRWMVVGALAALTAGSVGASNASAQTGGPVADGDFTGNIVLNGGFTANIDDSGATGAITVIVNASGPLSLALRGGEMSGDWSLSGQQNLNGAISASQAGADVTILITGGGPLSANGQMSGPPSDYRMTGTYTSTNTAEVTMPVVGTQSATTTDSGNLDLPLTDIIVLCGDIYGRWDYNVRQQIQQVGFDEFIRGYFTASTGVDATEQAETVETLISGVSQWAGEAPSLQPGDRSLYIGRALSLLARAQQLQAELVAPSPCPPDPTFATQLTLAAQDVISTLIAAYPGITNPQLVTMAAGSGAVGSGSPSPETAEALQAQMEADVQAKFDDLAANYPGLTTDDDLIDVARTAQMLGMESLTTDTGTELAPGDILILLGESS